MAQTTGTTTITRKPQDGESPVVYEIVPSRSIYYSDEVNEIPFKVYKVVGEKRELAHQDIEGGALALQSVSAGEVSYDEQVDFYYLTDSMNFVYGDNCGVRVMKDNVVVATFTWGFTKEGSAGVDGLIIRRTEWVEGKKYHNDTDREAAKKEKDFDGRFYLDEVTISSYKGGDGLRFVCRRTHTSSMTNKPKESDSITTYWEFLNVNAPVYTPFADITHAIIEYLQAKQLVIYEENEDGEIVPYGAFGGGDYPLWFGGTSPENAVFKVDKNGATSLANGNASFDKDGNVSVNNININGGTLEVNQVKTKFGHRIITGYKEVDGEIHVITEPILDLNSGTFFSGSLGGSSSMGIKIPYDTIYEGLQITLFYYSTTRIYTNGYFNTNIIYVGGNGEAIEYNNAIFLVDGWATFVLVGKHWVITSIFGRIDILSHNVVITSNGIEG